MRLNTKGRYAVMAMADLARHGQGKSIPMAEIAERQQISLSYLEQLFVKLRRAGLTESVRGPGGGYALARNPGDIYIADIMEAVGEPFKITRCESGEDGNGCLGGGNCITHELWTALGKHILLFLEKVTLKDVLQGTITVERTPIDEFIIEQSQKRSDRQAGDKEK